MNDNLLSVWRYTSTANARVQILPDGCRDLIIKSWGDEQASWIISSLFDQTKSKQITAGISMTGFRMRPGVRIDGKFSLAAKNIKFKNPSQIFSYLHDFTYLDSGINDALNYLSLDVKSLEHAASKIGVSLRTLQRLFIRETNRPPSYWFMLARIRRTARSLAEPMPLVELADRFGYADQAHMCREFRRWFNTSPSVLRASPDLLEQLKNSGYN